MSKCDSRSKRHTSEQIVAKLRSVDAMLNAEKALAGVLRSLWISEATFHRSRTHYGERKSEEAKRMKQPDNVPARLR